jgi:hypothetical protein
MQQANKIGQIHDVYGHKRVVVPRAAHWVGERHSHLSKNLDDGD